MSAQVLIAQETLPVKSTTSEESTPPSASAALELRISHLLKLSAEIVDKMEAKGVSHARLAEQKTLYHQIDLLLNPSKSKETQPIQSAGDSSGQLESVTDGGSGTNRSGSQSDGAGQAASGGSEAQQEGPLRLRQQLADSVWGHLPPRERNDLIRTYSESYLPEYEDQVRSYFEKLSKLKKRDFSRRPTQVESPD